MGNRKDEILELSRSAKQDEGLENMQNRGMVLGVNFFYGIAIILALVGMFAGSDVGHAVVITVSCFFGVQNATEQHSCYKFYGKRKNLIGTIVWGVFSAVFFALTLWVLVQSW
jgi:hypothetical protein